MAHSKSLLTPSPFVMGIPDPSLGPVAATPTPGSTQLRRRCSSVRKVWFRQERSGPSPRHPRTAKASCPHHLGGLLMFCSQISQAARKVHYSWPEKDLWVQTHYPSQPESGKPQARLFWGGEGGQPPPGPPGAKPSGRWKSECFIFSSIFRRTP